VITPNNGVVVRDLRVLLQDGGERPPSLRWWLAAAAGSVFGEFFDGPRRSEVQVQAAATGRVIASHEFDRGRDAERTRRRFVAEVDRRGLTARDDAEVRQLLAEVAADR